MKEATDARLKYSVTVPDDDKNAMEDFKPKESFGFQENFKRTLDSNNLKQPNSNINDEISKPKKSKLLRELKNSIRLLEDYINDADTKIYIPSSGVEYDAEDLVKIYLPKGRI